MRTVTNQKRIQLTLWSQLDNLDFVNDFISTSGTQPSADAQKKKHQTCISASRLNKLKTKIRRINVGTSEPVTLEGEELQVESCLFEQCNGQKWGNRGRCKN